MAKQDKVRVRCVVPNVHTSVGKLLSEQRADVDPLEAEALVAAGKCEVVPPGQDFDADEPEGGE